MLRASRAYVCWRCAARTAGSPGRLQRLEPSAGLRNAPPSNRAQGESHRAFATVHHASGDVPAAEGATSSKAAAYLATGGKPLGIRQKLKKWADENPSESTAMLTDHAYDGEVSNNFTRPQNISMAQMDVSSPLFEGDELSDLRSDEIQLQAGDLIEMSSDASRRPVLAVCLGRFNGYEHFYTNSGKWFSGLGVKSLFVIHNFVEPAELEPIIAEIPMNELSLETINALRDLGHDPSRSAGAPLLKKMIDFTQEAEAVYQTYAGTLDASSMFIGDPDKHRYLTLYEIADLLLPFSIKKNGRFIPAALYAVHRSLLLDEVFFRPLKRTGHRRSYLFEVSPLSEVRTVQRVEYLIRDYLEMPGWKRNIQPVDGTNVTDFIAHARSAIDQTRSVRKLSSHGIIGPSTSSTKLAVEWTSTDIEMLKFMELWAAYQRFPNYSRLQCIGSTILRLLKRYNDMRLDMSAGWTFLQEVGWITPWEIQSRYGIRFPDVEIKKGGGFARKLPGLTSGHLKPDILADQRKQWRGLTAFCIDATSTVDVDDGISVERTSNPEENWIHIHVADPASSILPDSPIAKFAELIPETVYLQGHFSRMLPADVGVANFSLAPGKPAMTFSALVNRSGTVLEHKITPGILQDVVYMTPEAVNEALGETREDPTASDEEMVVGGEYTPWPATRKMTEPQELTVEQRADLALLSELGKAVQQKRLDKGATPFFQARATPTVSLDGVTQKDDPMGFVTVAGDPVIRINYAARTGTDVVENTMKLAGEIAAKWCHERGIPIPYRSQPHASQNDVLIKQYMQDVLVPLYESGTSPDDSHWRHYRALLGGDELSTVPGPHFLIGADMYTKATSPLRRFGDLIVHWQIQAALLEEKRRGESLLGNKGESFLPFTRNRLDRMLPMLLVREKQARLLSNGNGADQWMLQALVRAWKFNEAQLPETFRFTVNHVVPKRNIMGNINWFNRSALLRPSALNDVVRMADVRVKDVFEVRLSDVNVHSNTVLVEAVRLLERTGPTADVPVPESPLVEDTPTAATV
ncbi:hypothetical protein JX265_006438 [Neoarthrinium moseri]|uniref:RNB domain-containing protein n=1 Tax=Neoarthrinium moseri TaxID=1658444 RepID=A0A9P9WM27_9PEZI|nr:hypothetical protein JX265_006438 [Neoarthrinium moseri]